MIDPHMLTMMSTKHHFAAGVYIKQMRLKRGHYAETHEHNYDHFGLLGAGEAVVELDGSCKVHVGPCIVLIEAGKKHKITALTDIEWFCIHATDETDPEKVDAVLIKGD